MVVSVSREPPDHRRCSWTGVASSQLPPSSDSLYWVEIAISPTLCCVRQEVSVAHCGERAERQPVHSLAVPPSTMKRHDHFHNQRTSKVLRTQHQFIVFGRKESPSPLRDRRVRCLCRRVCKSTSYISRSRCSCPSFTVSMKSGPVHAPECFTVFATTGSRRSARRGSGHGGLLACFRRRTQSRRRNLLGGYYHTWQKPAHT